MCFTLGRTLPSAQRHTVWREVPRRRAISDHQRPDSSWKSARRCGKSYVLLLWRVRCRSMLSRTFHRILQHALLVRASGPSGIRAQDGKRERPTSVACPLLRAGRVGAGSPSRPDSHVWCGLFALAGAPGLRRRSRPAQGVPPVHRGRLEPYVEGSSAVYIEPVGLLALPGGIHRRHPVAVLRAFLHVVIGVGHGLADRVDGGVLRQCLSVILPFWRAPRVHHVFDNGVAGRRFQVSSISCAVASPSRFCGLPGLASATVNEISRDPSVSPSSV